MAEKKKYPLYQKGLDAALDAEFAAAPAYSKIKVGQAHLFWKSGLRWHFMKLENVQRIFRRVEPVYGKLCCGGHSFFIEWLVLILHDGTEVVLHVGDDVTKKAQNLMITLQNVHPEIAYGKVY